MRPTYIRIALRRWAGIALYLEAVIRPVHCYEITNAFRVDQEMFAKIMYELLE